MDQDGLVIDKVAAEHGAITISRIKATYTLPDLRKGRVDTLTLSGLSMVINSDNRGLRIGNVQLGDLVDNVANSGGSDLPYNELRIEGGALILVMPAETMRGTLDLRVAEFNGAWQTTLGLLMKGRDGSAAFQGGGHINLHTPAKSTGDGAFEVSLTNMTLPSFADKLTLHGKGAFQIKDGSVQISSSTPLDATVIGLAPAWRAKLPPALVPPVTRGASLSARAVRFRERLDNRNATFAVDGLTASAGDDAFTGLTSTIDLTLSPFKIAKPQKLTVASLSVGELKLANLDAEFTAAPGKLGLPHVSADFAGGRVSVQNLTLPDLGPFALEVTTLDMSQLAALGKVDGLAVTGTVSGKIPVRIAKTAAQIEQATLTADAKGVIHYQPKDPGALGTAGGALALKALANFHYDSLSLTLNGSTAAEMAAAIAVAGRNPDVYRGYPIALNVNLTGRFADIIAQGLGAAHVPAAVLQQIKPARPTAAKRK